MAKKKTKKSKQIQPADPMMRVANEVLRELSTSKEAVEALNAVQRIVDAEDQHWTKILGAMEYDGITLEDLHSLDEEIREAIIKSPIIDRGAQLKHSYVWSKGVILPEADAGENRSGPKTRLHKILTNPVNKRYFFDEPAFEELERGLYSGGNVFGLIDTKAGEARRVPIKEITGLITHPDFADEVWAWKREWQHTNAEGKAEGKAVWHYTDECPLPRSKRLNKINDVPVDHDQTFVVQSVNRQIGWALGIPDAVAAVVWAKLYSEFLKHGYVMSRALASIAFRATVGTKTAGENASMKLANTDGAGNTAVMGAANSLTALPTAGRGYDFDSGRPIAAMVATAVQVSIVHLLSDPGAAGSSYGSASNLDLPTQRAVVARQKSWASYLARVIKTLGGGDVEVSFPSLEEPDFFRELQSIVAGWSTGLLHVEEVRERLLALLNIVTTKTAAPAGVMLPNNEKSWARNDIDPKDDPSKGNDQKVGQGHSTGTGKGKNADDLRSDGIGEAMQGLANLEIRDLLGQVMERLEEMRIKQGGH